MATLIKYAGRAESPCVCKRFRKKAKSPKTAFDAESVAKKHVEKNFFC